MGEMKSQVKNFNDKLNGKINDVKNQLIISIKSSCELIRSTSLDDMKNTQRNPDVAYYTYNKNIPHHPSLPGNAPAPDSGNLRDSVHYTTEESDSIIVGRVGTDVDYGRMLELGTSRIAPRPWLKPSLDKNRNQIERLIQQAVKKGLQK